MLALVSMAHVGSPDTFFTGHAGPYPVRVSVRLPGVDPRTRADVRSGFPGRPPEAISRSDRRRRFSGTSDPRARRRRIARVPVPGDPELLRGGSLADGADLVSRAGRGRRTAAAQGTAIVPVVALATAQREMPQGLGVVARRLGVFLAVGLLTIIGAAVRESVVPPGEAPEPRAPPPRAMGDGRHGVADRSRLRFGGRAWWNAEAAAYGSRSCIGRSTRPRPSDATARRSADARDRRSRAGRRRRQRATATTR